MRRAELRPAGPPPSVTAYDTDDVEAAGVADGLRAAHGPHIAWSSLAVLYRTNAQSAGFEEALTRAGIPFRVRGDARFLERPEVVSALARLKDAARIAPTRPFREHVIDLEADAASAPEAQREHVDALVRLAHGITAVEAGQAPSMASPDTSRLRCAVRHPVDGGAVDLLTFHTGRAPSSAPSSSPAWSAASSRSRTPRRRPSGQRSADCSM